MKIGPLSACYGSLLNRCDRLVQYSDNSGRSSIQGLEVGRRRSDGVSEEIAKNRCCLMRS